MSAVPFEYMPMYDIFELPSPEEVYESIGRNRAIGIGIQLFGGQERVFFSVKLAACQYNWESDELKFEGWGVCAGQTCRVSGILKFNNPEDKGSLHF